MIIKRTTSIAAQRSLSDESVQIMDLGDQQRPVERLITSCKQGGSRLFTIREGERHSVDKESLGFDVKGLYVRVDTKVTLILKQVFTEEDPSGSGTTSEETQLVTTLNRTRC